MSEVKKYYPRVKDGVEDITKLWIGSNLESWADKMWDVIGEKGLISYSTPAELLLVEIRSLCVAKMYLTFCMGAFQEGQLYENVYGGTNGHNFALGKSGRFPEEQMEILIKQYTDKDMEPEDSYYYIMDEEYSKLVKIIKEHYNNNDTIILVDLYKSVVDFKKAIDDIEDYDCDDEKTLKYNDYSKETIENMILDMVLNDSGAGMGMQIISEGFRV